MKRLLLLVLPLFLASCAAFTPDIYVGDGLWRRADGTTYQAPAPLQVKGVEVVKSRMAVSTGGYDAYGVLSKSLELTVTLKVILEDESSYDTFVTVRGVEGQTCYGSGVFTPSNGKSYNVSVKGILYEHAANTTVSISAPGPVRYQTGIDAY